MEDSFDALLTKLGTGKWNLMYAGFIAYWYSVLPYHTIAGVFLVPDVDYTCCPPPTTHNIPTTLVLQSSPTAHTYDNFTYRVDDLNLNLNSSCSYWVQNITTGHLEKEYCTKFDFDTSIFSSTVTSEFNLVCGRRYLRATYQSVYMFGMLLGAVFTALIADKYGRYTVLAISTLTYTTIALGSAWLPNLTSILIGRFLLGTMHPASLQTGYILTMEIIQMKHRSKVGLIQFLLWSLSTILFSAWAYLLRDWRWLQTIVSLPCLFFIPALWFLGESPRWLAVVGQHKRSLQELERAAKWNNVTLPSDQEILHIIRMVESEALVVNQAHSDAKTGKTKFQRLIDLLMVLIRTPKMRLITSVMAISYLTCGMLFFGLTLSTSIVELNLFMYVAISGVMELPAFTILIPFVTFFGLRKMLIFNLALSALVLLVHPMLPMGLEWLSVTLVMTGKMAASSVFSLLFLYCLELYPTEVRAQGMCTGLLWSRVGAIIAPYIISAMDKDHPWAISVVFGILAGVSGLAMLPLWETQNICLPDTIAELERRDKTENKTDSQNALV